MLKGIPSILSPELLRVLMEMGHGDEIILADGNFPGVSVARTLVRADGHPVPPLLEAILKLMPLDTYVDAPVSLMAVTPGDNIKPVIWDEYRSLVHAANPKAKIEFVERFAFYEKAKKAFAIVATGEKALYANILLKKGVVVD
jgi:L-fucose mutarotase